uniref:Transferred entry: 5.6.2.1 n=1 Tax=Steinernema glaseri TaxID=37863 RepID=A0A1I7ZMM3_9BILA
MSEVLSRAHRSRRNGDTKLLDEVSSVGHLLNFQPITSSKLEQILGQGDEKSYAFWPTAEPAVMHAGLV